MFSGVNETFLLQSLTADVGPQISMEAERSCVGARGRYHGCPRRSIDKTADVKAREKCQEMLSPELADAQKCSQCERGRAHGRIRRNRLASKGAGIRSAPRPGRGGPSPCTSAGFASARRTRETRRAWQNRRASDREYARCRKWNGSASARLMELPVGSRVPRHGIGQVEDSFRAVCDPQHQGNVLSVRPE